MAGVEFDVDVSFSASEMIVTRAFPIGSLVKEKRVSGRFRVGPNQWLSDCVQMRSCLFQVFLRYFFNCIMDILIACCQYLSCFKAFSSIGSLLVYFPYTFPKNCLRAAPIGHFDFILTIIQPCML